MKYIFSARVLKALKLDWKYGERIEVAALAMTYILAYYSVFELAITTIIKFI